MFWEYFWAIPHHSKCRYGERGAAAAKPKAQIILDAAKVSAASGGNSEPKQGQRSQSARGFCPRSTMRVPQPDIIEHFGNADAVPQPPERCLSRQAGIVRCCLWNSVLWNAVFCTVSERSRPFPTERYIMCNERITCSVGRDTLIPPRRNLVGLCCACKPSVKLHKTNDLLFPRLFPNTIPKRPQFAAQCQIIPVGIYDQICLVQAELAAFVQQALVHIHGNDFSQKQVVAA